MHETFSKCPNINKNKCINYLDEGGQQCDVAPAWIPFDDRIESAQTWATGVALELSVKVSPGFFNPLRMGGLTARPGLDNPVSYISIDIEMVCADQTCQLYFVQVSFINFCIVGKFAKLRLNNH